MHTYDVGVIIYSSQSRAHTFSRTIIKSIFFICYRLRYCLTFSIDRFAYVFLCHGLYTVVSRKHGKNGFERSKILAGYRSEK